MSITLTFNGGLFVTLPNIGDWHKVAAYLAHIESVDVTGGSDSVNKALEESIKNAYSVDFLSTRKGLPNFPMRQLSDLIPVNYDEFSKIIGFTGGEIKGRALRLNDSDLAAYAEAKSAGDKAEKAKAFKAISTNTGSDAEYANGIAQRFASTREEHVHRWKPGYKVDVILDDPQLRVRFDGGEARAVNGDLTITFNVTGRIPHFPLNNPHVLEQPPTI